MNKYYKVNRKDINKKLIIDIFYFANKLMLLRDKDEIKKDISERSICANIKEMMNRILSSIGLDCYYADVEYNRGGDKMIKAIIENNEAKPIQCDLIIHSRGKLHNDNLLCVEMKKEHRTGFNEDRNRLKELTKHELLFQQTKGNHYFVNGYMVGIFYILNIEQELIHLEFYQNSELVNERDITFDEMINFRTKLEMDIVGCSCSYLNQSPSVTFFNMGFGDSFLISDGTEKMLVDCGSINLTSREMRTALNDIESLMGFDKVNLLVTHYHKDHLNGIMELNKDGYKFETIFIRNLSKNNLEFDVASVFVELSYYAFKTGDFDTLFYWIDPRLLFNLLNSGGRVVGVNAINRNSFDIGGSLTAKVLWPSPNIDLYSRIKSDILAVFEAYSHIIKHLFKLITFYKRLFSRSDNGVWYFNGEADNYLTNDFSLTDEIKKEMVDEIVRMGESGKLSLLWRRLHNLENYLSIVFEIGDRLLMCGDATKRAMNSALKNSVYNNHKIVKVPHHGTTTYYLGKNWNGSSILLIPNSKYYPHRLINDKYVNGAASCFSLNASYDSSCPLARAGLCSSYKRGKTRFTIFKF